LSGAVYKYGFIFVFSKLFNLAVFINSVCFAYQQPLIIMVWYFMGFKHFKQRYDYY